MMASAVLLYFPDDTMARADREVARRRRERIALQKAGARSAQVLGPRVSRVKVMQEAARLGLAELERRRKVPKYVVSPRDEEQAADAGRRTARRRP